MQQSRSSSCSNVLRVLRENSVNYELALRPAPVLTPGSLEAAPLRAARLRRRAARGEVVGWHLMFPADTRARICQVSQATWVCARSVTADFHCLPASPALLCVVGR